MVLDHLAARQHEIPGTGDLAAHVDPNSPVAKGCQEDLRVFDVGLELLGEEVAQLLNGEPLDVQGAQPRQVHGAVGPDREGAAELRDVEQLDLQGVARAKDVGVVGDLGPLRCAGGSSSWARLRRPGGPPRTAGCDQAEDGDGAYDLSQIVFSDAGHAWEGKSARTSSAQQVDAG